MLKIIFFSIFIISSSLSFGEPIKDCKHLVGENANNEVLSSTEASQRESTTGFEKIRQSFVSPSSEILAVGKNSGYVEMGNIKSQMEKALYQVWTMAFSLKSNPSEKLESNFKKLSSLSVKFANYLNRFQIRKLNRSELEVPSRYYLRNFDIRFAKLGELNVKELSSDLTTLITNKTISAEVVEKMQNLIRGELTIASDFASYLDVLPILPILQVNKINLSVKTNLVLLRKLLLNSNLAKRKLYFAEKIKLIVNEYYRSIEKVKSEIYSEKSPQEIVDAIEVIFTKFELKYSVKKLVNEIEQQLGLDLSYSGITHLERAAIVDLLKDQVSHSAETWEATMNEMRNLLLPSN